MNVLKTDSRLQPYRTMTCGKVKTSYYGPLLPAARPPLRANPPSWEQHGPGSPRPGLFFAPI
jgi:hypothetical protein